MTEAARVRVLAGDDALDRLGGRLDDLHEATGAPVTARRVWLEAWSRWNPEYAPAAVVVGGDERLEAAALLAVRRGGAITRVVGLGHGPSDYARLSARDDPAGAALAAGIARFCEGLGGAWHLRLEQLPEGDPVARQVAARLPVAELVPGDGAPRVRFGEDRSARTYLSRNIYQSERSGWNRIKREGLTPSMSHLTTVEAIEGILPRMAEVRRKRDADVARRSAMNDEREHGFWRDVILGLAARGEAEVTVLWIEDEMAAYSVSLRDRGAYRMWDGRFDPAWAWFGAGRLTDLAAFHRARLSPDLHEYDWMRGLEDYKLRITSDVLPAEHLLAWSSRAVRAVERAPRRARGALRRVKERNETLRRAWEAVKRRTVARSPR